MSKKRNRNRHRFDFATPPVSVSADQRQKSLADAARYLAEEFSELGEVAGVAVFGSAIEALRAFRERERAPYDLDLIVWMTDLRRLDLLQEARARALDRLAAEQTIRIHERDVDIHILEPETDRYRGRLCPFAQCPTIERSECQVDGCGAQPFLQQLGHYRFRKWEFQNAGKELLLQRGFRLIREPSSDDLGFSDSDVPF